MNYHRILSLCVAPALAQFALAGEPAAPNAQALGMAEGILNRCAQIDPVAANRYRQKLELLTQGASEETVAKVRKSDEYKQAYDSIVDSLGQVDEHDAQRACTASLAENR
jgi:hypothetical protein